MGNVDIQWGWVFNGHRSCGCSSRSGSAWKVMRGGEVNCHGIGGAVADKQRGSLRTFKFTPCNPYIPFCCLYDIKMADVFFKFCSGSQVFSAEEYPFQDTRYNLQPGDPWCERISVTLYSSSPSISSGGGLMKFGLCLAIL